MKWKGYNAVSIYTHALMVIVALAATIVICHWVNRTGLLSGGEAELMVVGATVFTVFYGFGTWLWIQVLIKLK